MRIRLLPRAPFGLFVVAFAAIGCMANDDDLQAAAAPTTTGIPIGAPGAVGARLEAPTPAAFPYKPRTETIEEEINPKPVQPPSTAPVIPPSPFGEPPDDEDPPPTPPTKKQKGTKI